MPKSVFSGLNVHVVQNLIEPRRMAGLTQTEVARWIRKEQT